MLSCRGLLWIALGCLLQSSVACRAATYYLSNFGNDTNRGTSPAAAWKTLERANQQTFAPGDRLLLKGGETFRGSLAFGEKTAGTETRPIVVASFGRGKATLKAGHLSGIVLTNTSGFFLHDLVLEGDWNAETQAGNTGAGVAATCSLTGAKKLDFLRLERLEIRGFRNGGITINAFPSDKSKSGFRKVLISQCEVHDNADCGIGSNGAYSLTSTEYAHAGITVRDCRVYRNRGWTGKGGHTGSGIILSDVDGAVIERCIAFRNGDLTPPADGGPVGIWAWDARNVLIQHNESYENRSRAVDGGGFDFDGGMRDSLMQYNYSHDNDGSGYLIAQFGGRGMTGLTIRYNISQNDGRRNGYAGIHIWDSLAAGPDRPSHPDRLLDCDIYHNTVFVSPAAEGKPHALRIDTPTLHTRIANNLFVTTDGLSLMEVAPGQQSIEFAGNAYYSLAAPLLIQWEGKTFHSLEAWQQSTGQEMQGGKSVAVALDPKLDAPGGGGVIGNPSRLPTLKAYRLKNNSPLRGAGQNLKARFHLDAGNRDFWGNPVSQDAAPDIGACQTTPLPRVSLAETPNHPYSNDGEHTMHPFATLGGAMFGKASLLTGLMLPLLAPVAEPGNPAPRALEKIHGPLRVSRANPRYFTDNSGKAIFLTGSHTWSNFQDSRTLKRSKPFDYSAYLQFLEDHHHNFIRLWHWELPAWNEDDALLDKRNFSSPHPWVRVGTELAKDGKPKFDFTQFDPAYFALLRERTLAAQKSGIYVSIMLFEGWAMQFIKNAWSTHPFNPANHLGALAGPPADAKGVEIYELKYPEITALQEAYVRKVIETIGDLDNVLYEISNENHPESTEWQYHMIRFIKELEAKRPKQHPVGMSFQYAGGDNTLLFNSGADWIAPGSYWESDGLKPANFDKIENFRDDPPATDGRKVVFLDTDHLWGVGGNPGWVWRAFLRGYNVLCMDTIPSVTGFPDDPKFNLEPVRRAMGVVRTYAIKLDLAKMVPDNALASTGYCLASAGREYFVYAPDAKPFTVTLSAGTYHAEWIDAVTGTLQKGGSVSGGTAVSFHAPVAGEAVLHLHRN